MRKDFKYQHLVATNRKLAKQVWVDVLDLQQKRSLSEITRYFGFSIAMREILLLQGGWYVTHAGLVRLAKRRYCAGIDVEAVREFCDPIAARWSFKATVYKSKNGKGFVGHGDADPSNVSSLVRGAEMRVAETRAVNRALRKAYGIGLCSVEELGALSRPSKPAPVASPGAASNGSHSSNGSGNGHPRLRDQLCLLIRQYNLDANLVKAYAADFCGTEKLSGASRELVESFISHLSTAVKEDRDALVCKLNSYSQPTETTP
jgi:hypothetical protein